MSVLTQTQTLDLAALEIKHEAGKLTEPERWRRIELKNGTPVPRARLSLGARAATSLDFKRLAAKANGTAPLLEDVDLVKAGPREFKALITGASDTSAGAHITNARVELAPQPRRRLRILRSRPDRRDDAGRGGVRAAERVHERCRCDRGGHEYDDRHQARKRRSR